ncbi:MAG: hypothetical protein RL380_1050 [Verrucomicrobiota bacterium]|jgi:hypothetical protein
MNLSSDKRNKLIAAIAAIVLALGGLWYGLVHLSAKKLVATRGTFTGNQDHYGKMRRAVAAAPELEASLEAAQFKLATIERDMPSGDPYSWFIGTIKDFKANYRVDIPFYGNISGVETTTLVPNFPYKQLRITLAGTAFYQDYGKFLADFENRYPYMRVDNITLDPSTAIQQDSDREKLSFRMEIVALFNAPPDAEKK